MSILLNKKKNLIVSGIVAMSENRVIGKQNQLPWRLPADLKHFKAITTGHPILMGRKTYESIGRPLPNRTNIIITRNPHYLAEGCMVVTSLQTAIQQANDAQTDEIFIIGGTEVFQQSLAVIQRLYLTIIHHPFEGDAYFPALDEHQWQQTAVEHHHKDLENDYDYSFLTLNKIN